MGEVERGNSVGHVDGVVYQVFAIASYQSINQLVMSVDPCLFSKGYSLGLVWSMDFGGWSFNVDMDMEFNVITGQSFKIFAPVCNITRQSTTAFFSLLR